MKKHHGRLPCASESRVCRVGITVGFVAAMAVMSAVLVELIDEGASMTSVICMAGALVGLVVALVSSTKGPERHH